MGRLRDAAPDDVGLTRAIADTVRAPRALFARLAAAPRPALGRAAMLLLAVAWATLSLLLFAGGFRPARGVPFVPPAQHYLWQAVLLPSLLVVGWLLGASVADRVGRALGAPAAGAALRTTLGLAWAVPLGLAFVLPDLIVLVGWGHAALAPAMRWYGPVALAWTVVLGLLAVRAATGLGPGRALATTLAALLAQGAVLSLILR